MDSSSIDDPLYKKQEARQNPTKFDFWSHLNDDVKQHAIGYLDYKTRNHLSICSKADYEAVSKTPHYFRGIQITHSQDCFFERPNQLENVKVIVHFGGEDEMEKTFSQTGEDTLIRWFGDDIPLTTQQEVWKDCNFRDAAVKYAENWMKKGQFKLEHLIIDMENYPFERSIIKKLPNCKQVRIGSDQEEQVKWWLEKAGDDINYLYITRPITPRREMILPTEVFSLPSVRNAKDIQIDFKSEITDEQLLELKASRIAFVEVTITDNGINAFLQKWSRGEYGENFHELSLELDHDADESVITRGLRIRRWDEEFMREAGIGFHHMRNGLTLQVISKSDPYQSLTFRITNNKVNISWTGHKATLNGKEVTLYML